MSGLWRPRAHMPMISAFFAQDVDTNPRIECIPGGRLLYTYQRSQEFAQEGENGQDFLAFLYDDERIVFALCDGVGQSFFGDIAARFLGVNLVRWLWSIDRRPHSDQAFRENLEKELNAWTNQATKIVSGYQMGPEIFELQKQALTMKRDEAGSEAMFIGGWLHFPQKQLILCWMGDTEFQLWDTHLIQIPIRAEFNTAERWSSRLGLEGPLHVASFSLEGIGKIVVYTDGILTHKDKLGSLSKSRLEDIIGVLSQDSNNDDLALLEITIESHPRQASQLLQPTNLRIENSALVWEPISDAEWYRVEIYNKKNQLIEMYETVLNHYDIPYHIAEGLIRVRALSSRALPSPSSEIRATFPHEPILSSVSEPPKSECSVEVDQHTVRKPEIHAPAYHKARPSYSPVPRVVKRETRDGRRDQKKWGAFALITIVLGIILIFLTLCLYDRQSQDNIIIRDPAVPTLTDPSEGIGDPRQSMHISFEIDKQVIPLGECVDVLWNVENAESTEIIQVSNGVAIQTIPVASSGKQSLCPKITSIYILRANSNGHSVTQQRAIVVEASPITTVIPTQEDVRDP